jgi:hypothetical protein
MSILQEHNRASLIFFIEQGGLNLQISMWRLLTYQVKSKGKGKGLPQQAEVALGVPGRLRPRIFLTFGTTRVVGRQPYAQAAFNPGEIPGTQF